MGEEITYAVNDTTRIIEKQILHLKKWRKDNNRCDDYFTDLLLIKLEEAYLLSLKIVKSL